MKTVQLYYPFDFSKLNNLNASNVTYMQIGIEQPHSIPYYFYNYENKELTDKQIVSIDSSTQVVTPYLITDKDILEWGNLSTNFLDTNILLENLSDEDKKYLIIDIGYEE